MSHGPRHPVQTKQLDAQRSCVELGECRPRARSSKNTRDWCKGREGVPHAYLWEVDAEWVGRFGPERWVRQVQRCFGCGRKHWFTRRTFCGACGSPERYYSLHRDGTLAYPRRTSRGYLVYDDWRTTQYGPFCLCPDHFDHRAAPARGILFDMDEVLWTDDPMQILALRGLTP